MYQCKKALVSWLAVFVGDVEGIIQKKLSSSGYKIYYEEQGGKNVERLLQTLLTLSEHGRGESREDLYPCTLCLVIVKRQR